MNASLKELRHNPLYWLLVFVPGVLIAERLRPEAHTALFLLSIAAIVPLAGLLSRATESVAAKTGDAVGGLLNATLGNLTELVIAITALRAGMIDLVKASMTGAVVTNSLFMLGGAFVLGGLRHRVQEFNPKNARVQAGMLLLATIALLIPSCGRSRGPVERPVLHAAAQPEPRLHPPRHLCAEPLFSLKTHRDFFAERRRRRARETPWPLPDGARLPRVRDTRHRVRQRDLRRDPCRRPPSPSGCPGPSSGLSSCRWSAPPPR